MVPGGQTLYQTDWTYKCRIFQHIKYSSERYIVLATVSKDKIILASVNIFLSAFGSPQN